MTGTLGKVKRRVFLQFACTALPLFALDEQRDPWDAPELMEAADLAALLSKSDNLIHVICVAFPVLYRQRHIAGATLAGPGSKPEGIEQLNGELRKLNSDDIVVLYCGCCPMQQCPNIRPAYVATKKIGVKNVRVLNLPHNFHTDWAAKGYPIT